MSTVSYISYNTCKHCDSATLLKHCQLPAQPKATKPEDHIGVRPNKSTKPTQAH